MNMIPLYLSLLVGTTMILRLALIFLTIISAQLTAAESHAETPKSAQDKPAKLFSVALVKTEASSDFKRAIVVGEKTFYVSAKRGMTLQDVSSVSLKKDDKGALELLIQWTAAGAKKHEAFTAAHVGEHLVFLIKGKPVKVVKITEKISGDRLSLHVGKLDKAQALISEIAARLKARK